MRLVPRRSRKIDRLKRAGDVDVLRAMLYHGHLVSTADPRAPAVDAHRRAEAVAALATLDSPGVEDGLAHALADPDRGVRQEALDALAARSEPTAADALLEAVARWPYPDDYGALEKALAVLVGWCPDGAPERFARTLLDPSVPELDERHEDALAALLTGDPGDGAAGRVADALVADLGGDLDAAAESRAQRMLGWLGPAGADAVLRALDHDGPGPGTVRAAGLLRDARAVDPLVGVLGASDPALRSGAATALGHLNDTRAVQALIGATQDPEHIVRDAASEALNGMGVAAVIVGVASVMRETVRDQLAAEHGDSQRHELTASTGNSLPSPEDLSAAHPPTWAQEVLGRLLKRMGS